MNVVAPGEKPRLRPPRNRIDRRAVLWWTLRALIGSVVFVGGGLVAFALFPDARPWVWPPLVLFAVIGLVLTLITPRWRYRVHRWEVTDEAVYTATGWFTKEWRVAPMSRIQTVDTERGPLQQWLGLAKVTVTTASSAGNIEIEGLDAEVAERVSRQLADAAGLTEGDAT
ncbi:PH domain-containing protein [Stackebrandtia nassauensis]|uniref:Membrane-flanked domain protein n=1 Tax=Stackebrandtia nassauensis (strain DSM 44728 / CIP 108903 / NRRL B-16338 / NBRC 102104 / LLR-40K-21) TaxID=446470 RepID=D3QAR0_STANL|nr:PH domain-containing protein [Stackebrandtia nassauensis]ADD44706.1 membrane-flanked domain protein [Stackebrandtia nassauensis DSM 44728]